MHTGILHSTGSVWTEEPAFSAQPLRHDVDCDVCVVGAGIAGLLIAHRLIDEGRDVVILERGDVCRGETGHTTAHVTSALDDRYLTLERVHGAEGARLAAASHTAAIDYLERLVGELGVECGWKRLDGYLTVNEKHRDKAHDLLEQEYAAAVRAGLSPERVDSLPAGWPTGVGPALRFERQGQMHPVRLLNRVAQEIVSRGGRLYTHTAMSSLNASHNVVETEGGAVVHCPNVVVATNTPVNDRVTIHTKQAAYQTYVTAFRIPAFQLPPILLWDGLWDHDTSYHYVRLLVGGAANGDDLLIVGGEDHKTGQGPDDDGPFRRLEEWTREHFPMCGEEAWRWSGEVMEPADGLAFIGHNPIAGEHVYVVTGDSGNGITHGAIAAMVIPDLIAGRANPWSKLYDPARKVGLRALGDYARENLDTVAQYTDWLKRGPADESAIAPGTGAVLSCGLRHVAVSRDETGHCTHVSAVCPHLGGIVRWNSIEKTWDCPAHGSRFCCDGKVMHGPANRSLRPNPCDQPESNGNSPASPEDNK